MSFFKRPGKLLLSDNVNYERKFIFIHIPKNAGTSIYQSLGLGKSCHFTCCEYEEALGRLQYNRMFKFCFVRNPYDRFLSLYDYARMEESYYHSSINPEKALYGKHMDYDKLKNVTLKDCARMLVEGKLEHNPPHNQWRPQTTWILNDANQVMVDYIGRVEDIDLHFANISRILRFPDAKIQKINDSRSKGPCRDVYSKDVKSLIADFYRSDFEIFGYKF